MRARVARVPLAAILVAGLTILASLALLFVGGRITGVSWDEPYRVGKLNNFLTTGWFVDDVKDGVPLDFNAYVYAPIADLFSHAVGVLAGAQDWATASVSADAYAARHLAIGLLAVAGLACVALLTGVLLGSWRWAVLAAALLASVPLWTGHAMFNASDIPVATGYTIATLGAVLLVRTMGKRQQRLPSLLGTGAVLALGIILTVGSRPATWPALLVTCAIPVAAAPLLTGAGRRRAAAGRASLVSGAALLASYAVLLLAYPKAFGQPVRLLIDSVTQSAQFGPQSVEPVKPAFLESAGYVPSWLAVQLPIAIAILVPLGLGAAAGFVLYLLSRRSAPGDLRWRAAGVIVVAAQLLVLPAGAALMRSYVYDGIRQFLFVVPVLAVFATFGLAALVTAVSRLHRGAVVAQATVWVLVTVGLALPIADQVRLFPYGYAYVNEIAAREPINGRIPTDYWRTSMRELVPRVPVDGSTDCTFGPLTVGMVPIDCATAGQISPYWERRGAQAIRVQVPDGKYLFMQSNRGPVDPGPSCTVLDRVTRPLHGQEVVMSYVALCDAPCEIQEQAQCSGDDLNGVVLDGLNLSGSDLTSASMLKTSLILADLRGADLTGANLTGAILASTDFSGANLSYAYLTDANLTGANLTGANLTGAHLEGAVLDGADLTGAIGYTPPE